MLRRPGGWGSPFPNRAIERGAQPYDCAQGPEPAETAPADAETRNRYRHLPP